CLKSREQWRTIDGLRVGARLAPRRDERYGALARNFRPSFTVGVVNVAAQQRPAAFPSWTRSGTGSGVTAAGSASRLPLPLTLMRATGSDGSPLRLSVTPAMPSGVASRFL